MKEEKVYQMEFSRIYPLLLNKVERKGRTREELDKVIGWLTGYGREELERLLQEPVSCAQFFEQAPRWNENWEKITGVVCGVRVEEIQAPLMRRIRCLDKLVDELAGGKPLEKVLRG